LTIRLRNAINKFKVTGESISDQETVSLYERPERASDLVLQMLTDGLWAEVEIGGEHLRLFSEHNAQGIQASVYNVKTKTWIAPSEPVDDIEQGKDRAEEFAKAYLKRVAGLDLPPLQWKESRAR
jgi:hypothetical protein